MKRLFFFLLWALPFACFSQITFEKTFSAQLQPTSTLWQALPLLYQIDTEANRIRLYDADNAYTLIADIDVAAVAPKGYVLYSVGSLTRDYVNTDALHELHLICSNASRVSSDTYMWSAIVNERGVVLKDFGYAYTFNGMYFRSGNTCKFLLHRYQLHSDGSGYSIQSEIYALDGNPASVAAVEEAPALPFPNPSTQTVTFAVPLSSSASSAFVYDARGEQVERCFLPAGKEEFVLNVSGYPAGMYFFRSGNLSLPFAVN